MNAKRAAVWVLVLLSALFLASCAEEEVPAEPPDLVGFWQQPNIENAAYFHRAIVTEDTISVYWYEPESDTTRLFWAGSFIPPQDGAEPYVWDSVNDLERAKKSRMALRDETKPFTYEDGKITYAVYYGRIKAVGALEKVDAWTEFS